MTRSGFTAVGGLVETYTDDDGSLISQPSGSVAWTSRDGRHWRRPTALGGDFEVSTAEDVAVARDRTVVDGGLDACIQSWTSIRRSPW